MNTLYVVGGIVILLLILLLSVKYIVNDKHTLTELLPANEETKIAHSDMATRQNVSYNFTYSIWLYVNDWNYNYGNYKPIFGKYVGASTNAGKGQSYIEQLESCHQTYSSSSCDSLLPSPVVTFDKNNNDILIYMAGSDEIFKCKVSNIALQKWVNLTISLHKKTLDIYINGKLSKTCVLPSVPKLDATKQDVFICSGDNEDDKGFSGYTSKFQYLPYSTNPQQAYDIYTNGFGDMSSLMGDFKFKFSLLENGNITNTWTL